MYSQLSASQLVNIINPHHLTWYPISCTKYARVMQHSLTTCTIITISIINTIPLHITCVLTSFKQHFNGRTKFLSLPANSWSCPAPPETIALTCRSDCKKTLPSWSSPPSPPSPPHLHPPPPMKTGQSCPNSHQLKVQTCQWPDSHLARHRKLLHETVLIYTCNMGVCRHL